LIFSHQIPPDKPRRTPLARRKLDKLHHPPLCSRNTVASPARQPMQRKHRPPMTPAEVDTAIRTLIEPFNKKGVAIADSTTFAGDLEFDSLTVMDFVAEIEDEFDVIISMNQQAEIENWGQLVAAVHKLQDS
jgi:acyl carrier protein